MKKATQFISLLLVAAMLAIPAGATMFTPSVEQKGAPTQYPDSKLVVTDQDGNVVEDDCLELLAVADLEDATEEEKALLEEAYKVIAEAESLEEAVPGLTEALEDRQSKLTGDDLVVRDLFNVRVCEVCDKILEEGGSITVTFLAEGIKTEDFLMVLHYVEDTWEVMDEESVVVEEEDKVAVTFTGCVGPVAFVVEKTERS